MFEYIYQPNQNKNNEKESLFKQLSKVDEKYTLQDPTPRDILEEELPKYERIVFEKPSEDETKTKAEVDLEGYKSSGISTIDEKYDTKITTNAGKISAADAAAQAEQKKLIEKYDALKQSTVNKNIQRGLVNSSIFKTQLSDADAAENSDIKQASENARSKIDSLSMEIKLLERQKESAMAAFDINYAIKLSDKISALNKEIAKQEEEVQKYNNSLLKQEEKDLLEREKQAEKYESDIQKQNAELIKLLGTYGVKGLEQLKTQEKFDLILNYLMSLPKIAAIDELNQDQAYSEQLGSRYSEMYAKILKRKD